MALSVTLLCLLVIFSTFSLSTALSLNYYAKTCPGAEAAIAKAIKKAAAKDKTVPAALLRLHFHDCFIRVNSKLQSLFDISGKKKLKFNLIWILTSFFEGVWCIGAARFDRKEQCRESRTAKSISARLFRYWQCKKGGRIHMSWSSVLCWCLGLGCKRCSSPCMLNATIL